MPEVTIPTSEELPMSSERVTQLETELATCIAERQPGYQDNRELWSAVQALDLLVKHYREDDI